MNIRRGVDTRERRGFFKWSDIKFWIDHYEIGTGFSVAFFTPGSVGDGNHEEGALFAVGIVLVALEKAS